MASVILRSQKGLILLYASLKDKIRELIKSTWSKEENKYERIK